MSNIIYTADKKRLEIDNSEYPVKIFQEGYSIFLTVQDLKELKPIIDKILEDE